MSFCLEVNYMLRDEDTALQNALLCSLILQDSKLTVGYDKELLHFQVSGDISQTHALSVIGPNQRQKQNHQTDLLSQLLAPQEIITERQKKLLFHCFFFKTYGTLQESTFPSAMESSLNYAFVFCRKKLGKQKADYASVIYSQVSKSSVVRDTSCSRCFEQELPEKQRGNETGVGCEGKCRAFSRRLCC